MNYKLNELVEIHSGVVLSRKEAPPESPNAIPYQRLTLRALSDAGTIQRTELEQYYSREALDPELFTTAEDVVVRLCTPINPVLIQNEQAGILIPSQLAAIRVKDSAALMPSYLSMGQRRERLRSNPYWIWSSICRPCRFKSRLQRSTLCPGVGKRCTGN